jgi:putative sigma-54 modulation protein
MHIEIHPSNVDLRSEYVERIERRIQFSLSRIGKRIRLIEVRLSDINGPRGGIDKRCRVLVHLEQQQGAPIVVEKHGADVFELIDRAIDSVGQSARKRLSWTSQWRRTKSSVLENV